MSAIAACFAENGPSAVFSFQAIEAMDHPPNATAQPDERMPEVGRRERALECPDVGQRACAVGLTETMNYQRARPVLYTILEVRERRRAVPVDAKHLRPSENVMRDSSVAAGSI